jgi:acid phosphatase type 7
MKYEVDLYLAGHYHSYERTCAVYRNVCQQNGIIHVLVGTGGASHTTLSYDQVTWSKFHAQVYGFLHIYTTSTTLRIDFISSENKTILDTVTLNARSFSPKETSKYNGQNYYLQSNPKSNDDFE